MKQRRTLYRFDNVKLSPLFKFSYSKSSLCLGISLIVSKGEKVLLIRTNFDAVDADVRLDLRNKVEHSNYILFNKNG